jgi:hypothetical protein
MKPRKFQPSKYPDPTSPFGHKILLAIISGKSCFSLMDSTMIKIQSSQPYLSLPQVHVYDMGTNALLFKGPLQVLQMTVTNADHTNPTVMVHSNAGYFSCLMFHSIF